MVNDVDEDIIKRICLFLPATLRAPNGDEIKYYKDDADEVVRHKPPSCGIAILSDDPEDGGRVLQGPDTTTTEQVSETKTFVTGTLDYRLDEREVDSVVSVTGTAGGGTRTFVLDTDYELVASADWPVKDTIRWKTGGTHPDNGTSFTITYKHVLHQEQFLAYRTVLARLLLRVPELKSGQNGATTDHLNQSVLGWSMHDSLVRRLLAKQGKPVTTTSAALIFTGIASLGKNPVPAEENVSEWALDLRLRRRTLLERGDAVRAAHDYEVSPDPQS